MCGQARPSRDPSQGGGKGREVTMHSQPPNQAKQDVAGKRRTGLGWGAGLGDGLGMVPRCLRTGGGLGCLFCARSPHSPLPAHPGSSSSYDRGFPTGHHELFSTFSWDDQKVRRVFIRKVMLPPTPALLDWNPQRAPPFSPPSWGGGVPAISTSRHPATPACTAATSNY